MKMIDTSAQATPVPNVERRLLNRGLDRLHDFHASNERLRRALADLKTLADATTGKHVDRLLRQLHIHEPSVTMIGQIKSGKTSLVNALVGYPDLLPADVNPWTSVVTSLHINPETPGFENSASFRFFDENEWDRLISGGGRIGELASRAGADEELETIQKQVAEMREKSRARLGRKFEVMLGQQRDYGYFDKDLIQRYVCLGDANAPDGDQQGRFADITRSADLEMQRPGLPFKLCIRDTPGVNDTFMMREQITIKSIRDSRICVVVLSAHQALSSTDLALIRLISNVKSRDVIIFVNRIDELSDPSEQIPTIERSILQTLTRHQGPADPLIIFGSAMWANHALTATLHDLPRQSAKALMNWAQSGSVNDPSDEDSEAAAWDLSGLPHLLDAIGERVAHGIGDAHAKRVAESAINIASGLAAADQIGRVRPEIADAPPLDAAAAMQRLKDLEARHLTQITASLDDAMEAFRARINRAQLSFLERATAALLTHLDNYGEDSPWTYDPAGLRVLLSSSHKVLTAKCNSAFQEQARSAGTDIAMLYLQAFGTAADGVQIKVPDAPHIPPPVELGQTIALDLSTTWWKRWWAQRRGYKAYAANYQDLIRAETEPVVEALRNSVAEDIRTRFAAAFSSFVTEQVEIFTSVSQQAAGDPAARPHNLPQLATDRTARLTKTIATLEGYI
jgi:hypothetical protein